LEDAHEYKRGLGGEKIYIKISARKGSTFEKEEDLERTEKTLNESEQHLTSERLQGSKGFESKVL